MAEVVDDMMEIVKQAMTAQYASVMPPGFSIWRIAEYDPEKHRAPNLWLEKREKPTARYLVQLHSDTASVPALGETVNDAVQAAIAKAAKMVADRERGVCPICQDQGTLLNLDSGEHECCPLCKPTQQ